MFVNIYVHKTVVLINYFTITNLLLVFLLSHNYNSINFYYGRKNISLAFTLATINCF